MAVCSQGRRRRPSRPAPAPTIRAVGSHPATIVPLVAYSYYSLGHGVASPEELVRRATQLGAGAMALTDVETLAGQVRFNHACREVGIRPITGIELRRGHTRRTVGEYRGRVVLLVEDEAGFQKLCRLVSVRRASRDAEPTPDPVDDLPEDLDGLFVLAFETGTLSRLASRYVGQARRLWLVARSAAQAAELGGVVTPDLARQMVATPVVLALDERDTAVHRLAAAIRASGSLPDAEPLGGASDAQRRPFDIGTLRSFGGAGPELERAEALAAQCGFDIGRVAGVKPGPRELTADAVGDLLRERCEEALRSSAVSETESFSTYESRLEEELRVIGQLGYGEYLLVVAEIARGARQLGLPIAARGSAAGSLVVHLLGLTALDPIAHDLLFERFLNARRAAPADVDLDVASSGRGRLLDWIGRRFGPDHVAGIATHTTFRGRSAVRSGLAALGMAPSRIATLMRGFRPPHGDPAAEAGYVRSFLERSSYEVAARNADAIAGLVGMPSHVSVHPAGIVISASPLAGQLPLETAPAGKTITQFDHQSLGAVGVVKFDVLGNHFLSEMSDVLASKAAGSGPALDDEATRLTIDAADTIGCFQIESPAVRSVLNRMPIRGFEDVIAALAVVRPGAATGAAKERYLRRARGEQPFDPLEALGDPAAARELPGSDSLARRLSRSYGVLLYDEDIIHLLSVAGGCDLAVADAWRAAIIEAADDRDAMLRLEHAFESAAAQAGRPRKIAKRAWVSAARFASYSFARAHAASYADLAWRAAWLRTHTPVQFACALLNHHQGMYPDRTLAAAIQRWGVSLRLPDVNRSLFAATVVGGEVLLGLGRIKGLSRRAAKAMVRGRPFATLAELVATVGPSKRELSALVMSGACDGLPPLSASGYPELHASVIAGFVIGSTPQARSAAAAARRTPPREARDDDRYRALVRVRNELELLGLHVTNHPMGLLREEARALGCTKVVEVGREAQPKVKVAGMLAASRRVATASGVIRFLTVEDESGLLEALLPADVNARVDASVTTSGPYLFTGRVRKEGGGITLLVSDVRPFHAR